MPHPFPSSSPSPLLLRSSPSPSPLVLSSTLCPPLPLISSSSAPSPLLFLLYSSPLPILSSTDGDCDAGDNDGRPCDDDDGDGAGDGNVDDDGDDDCAESAMKVLAKLAERARVHERAVHFVCAPVALACMQHGTGSNS